MDVRHYLGHFVLRRGLILDDVVEKISFVLDFKLPERSEGTHA